MTTAHRPTWAPAKGGDNEGGFKSYAPSSLVRAKDINAGGTLKLRADLDGSSLSAAALRAELEARERKHMREQRAAEFDEEKEKDVLLLEARDKGGTTLVPNDADADDASDDGGGSDGAASSSDDDDDDDESDDEAALLAELEKIKAERAAAAAAAAADEARAGEAAVRDAMLAGNPLMAGGGVEAEFGVKRAFGDDTVFRNAARAPPAKAAKTFVNDTVRSEFHKRFMRRFFA